MAYYFFLSAIPLPITPSKLTVSTPSNNKVVTLINEGEISILKKKGLKEISFDALLPHTKYPFTNDSLLGFMDVNAFIVALKGLEALNKPFPFIVTRMSPSGKLLFFTSMMVTLEDYDLIEDAENYGLDTVLSIRLKEYGSYGTSIFKNMAMTAVGAVASGAMALFSKSRDSSSKVTPKTYTVKQGDTLWGIAKREYNDGEKYKDLAKLNNISNPNKIQIGQVLRLS